MRRTILLSALGFASVALASPSPFPSDHEHFGVAADAHFPLRARGTNKNGSTPTYKNPNAAIEDRINDLLPRMTVEEKVAQL